MFSRRRFLQIAAASTGLAITGGDLLSQAVANASPLIRPNGSNGIEHVAILMMENRSFDHFLGWLPGANGRQSGLSFADSQGNVHSTHALANDAPTGDFQGCPFLDPGHSFNDGRVQYHGGAVDGWLFDGSDESTTNPLQ